MFLSDNNLRLMHRRLDTTQARSLSVTTAGRMVRVYPSGDQYECDPRQEPGDLELVRISAGLGGVRIEVYKFMDKARCIRWCRRIETPGGDHWWEPWSAAREHGGPSSKQELSAMTHEELQNTVTRIIAEQFDLEEDAVQRDTHMQDDLNCDSLDCVELVMLFEDEFEIDLPDNGIEGIQTVGGVVDYLAGRLIDGVMR